MHNRGDGPAANRRQAKIGPVNRPTQIPDARPCQPPRARLVQWLSVRCCVSAMCLASTLAAAPGAPAAPNGDAGEAVFAGQVLNAVNQYRAHRALAAWPSDEGLVTIALDHSRLMAWRTQLGHDGFDRRFQQALSRQCVETLAAGFCDAEALVAAWRQSPSHHDTMLEPQTRRAGVASVDGYVTLLACD